MANNNGNQIEARLWEADDELRANSKLKASEYSVPVLGLVFLRYADFKFQIVAEELEGTSTGRRPVATRFDTLVTGPMLYQPKHIANFSLGFNRKGLNVWLSYQYNGMIFTDKNLRLDDLDRLKAQFYRWDLQVTQQFSGRLKGLEVMANLANISNFNEVSRLRGDPRFTYMESYGWTLDLGLRYKIP